MPAIVSLRDVVEELDFTNDECTAFVNVKTGKPLTLTDDDISLLEEGGSDEIPQWQQALIDELREPFAAGHLVELPSRFDIDEYSLMQEFASGLANADARDELLAAIRGSRPFRRFKDSCHRLGLRGEWHSYRTTALEELVADWLRDHNTPFSREASDDQPS